ncbi:MAG: thiamine diphosphokinase [Ignavibacteria bacterium 13_1_40CM_2_61_4]|nr:MAG: thiamine diphosphokinase [Ignavibacteria bacterium 13_1_40CM_2_61_4]
MTSSRRSSRALILANGPFPPPDVLRELRAHAALIVCADGGANWALRSKIKPDIILGDLDSILPSTKRHFRDTPILKMEDQESTDLEKAIRYCIGRRAASADIIGALGERIDHTTGSLGCFKKFGNRIRLRFVDGAGELTQIGRSVRFKTRKGEKVSIIPLDRCTGVTTRNLKYALKNGTLELGVREGISNEATGAVASVAVKTGTLLLYRFRNSG